MKNLIKKLTEVEKDIAREKGGFTLFGLFHREGALSDKWDLVAAAPWFGENTYEETKYIVSKMKPKLTTEEMIMVSRIVLLDPNEPFVKEMADRIKRKRGVAEVSNYLFNGMMIERGHVITAMAA